MNVVAAGVVVRLEPEGFSVVGWHRHELLVKGFTGDDVYERLTYTEMVDVVLSHLDMYRPGDPCGKCTGWTQLSLWSSSGSSGRT